MRIGFEFTPPEQDTSDLFFCDDTTRGAAKISPFALDGGDESGIDRTAFKFAIDSGGKIFLVVHRLFKLTIFNGALDKEIEREEVDVVDFSK